MHALSLTLVLSTLLAPSAYILPNALGSAGGESQSANDPSITSAFPGFNGKIAFVSEGDHGVNEVFVMNADGSDQTRLTSNDVFDSDPDWGPATSPVGQIEALKDTINGIGISENLKRSLLGPLHNIEKILTDGNTTNDRAASKKLNSFISAVDAKTDKKGGLTQTEADELLSQAQAIKNAIEC